MSAQKLFLSILAGCLLMLSANAQSSVVKTTQVLMLGETAVNINIYEKAGSRITFYAPHYNEQTGSKIVKEILEKRGGRLIEVESISENGNPARFVKFTYQTKTYSLDPNRIFTDNGLTCSGYTPEVIPLVKSFADNLLKIIFSPNGTSLRSDEKFLVAVHNNADVDAADKSESDKARDLTANAYARSTKSEFSSTGAFSDQADGVYLSNTEYDSDNFLFISDIKLLGFFAEKGFNTVIQKSAQKLLSKECSIDDGSLSVFSGQHNISYINIEADTVSGGFRQRQMIESIYELLQKINQSGSTVRGEVIK